MGPRLAVHSLALGGFVVSGGSLGGCGEQATPWATQLEADSPCYHVDVSDGLSDGAEVDGLFHCLDHHGHLSPLRPAAQALGEGSSPTPGDRLAEAQRATRGVDLDPFAGVSVAAAWLADPERPTDQVLNSLAELATGVPASELIATPEAAHALERSPLQALAPALPHIAEGLLDEPRALGEVADALQHDALPAWLDALARASDRAGVDGWLQAVGEARPLTRSPQNDRHPGATGDSLRDLVEVWWLRDGATLERLVPYLAVLLDGPSERRALAASVADAYDSGDLEQLGTSLAWLASVDRHGAPLTDLDEPSALTRLARVFATTNAPVECELDLWITSFEWSFDNLAVRLLQWVANLDDEGIDSAGSLLGSLSDNAVSEAVLELAIASGTCPSITQETLDDLDAVVLLFEEPADPTKTVLVGALRAVPAERLPAVADALTTAWEAGGVPPLEEFVRDVGTTRAVGGLGRLVGALATSGGPTEPTLEEALGWLHQLSLAPERRGRLDHLGSTVLGSDPAWSAIDRGAELLAVPDSELTHLPELTREIVASDPELALFEPLRTVLATEAVVRPLLQVLAEPAVVAAVFPEQSSTDTPAPAPWLALRLTDGTLTGLLSVVSDLLGAAGYRSGSGQ